MKEWTPQVRANWLKDGHLPRSAIPALAHAGLFRTRWEHGESGGLPFAVILAEETALVSSGLGEAVTLHSEVFLGLLARLARSPSQKELFENGLNGSVVGCFAVTESGGGSDIAGVETTIHRDGNSLRLHGEKRFISNAGRATHCIVLAKDGDLAAGRNLSIIAVPLDNPGVRITGYYAKAGNEDCDTAHLEFDAKLQPDAVLGVPGLGLVYTMKALQLERIAISAQLIVAARHCLRLASAHMRRRSQFGVRLMDHQALRHRLADSAVKVWAAESFLAAVVVAARAGGNVDHETAGLKLLAANTAGTVIDETLQIFGGRGYTKNYPIEQAWRDARLARIGAGTDEIMREIVATAFDRSDEESDLILEELENMDRPTLD